jgi:Ca-activated chloride channel family protein
VTYAGSAGVVLEPTRVSDMGAILGALSRLSAGGSTAGAAGLEQAYQVAASMQQDGQSARVILATDGDFNVGISGAAPLTEYIADKRESGIRLSVLGFGRGNYNDQTMQALAQNGNGVAAYIDTLAEADKVLSEEITGALITIASDVKIQVEFNPAQISEYRLVGYETRALNREDFNNDRVDAGDIGAGHSVTAIYEITPRGSDAEMVDAMRYQSEDVATSRDEYAFVKLRYKRPGETQSNLLELPVTADTDAIAPEDQDWASAVVGAARLMRGEDLGDWSLSDARDLATSARGNDPHGYRAEFMRLLGLLPE